MLLLGETFARHTQHIHRAVKFAEKISVGLLTCCNMYNKGLLTCLIGRMNRLALIGLRGRHGVTKLGRMFGLLHLLDGRRGCLVL